MWAAALALACGDGEAPDPAPEPAADAEPRPPAPDARRAYQRSIVFMTLDEDSTLVVPFLFETHTDDQGADRRVRGWLGRSGAWEPFLDQRWRTPATRTPWRLLPRGPLRLVVGLDDALEEIVYEEGSRSLELDFGGLLAEWTTPNQQVYRIHDGAVTLASRRVDGALLDVNRTRPPGPVHGDLAFLASGDSLQLIVDGVRPVDVPLGGAAAWARLDFRQLDWVDLTLEWTEVRAFERARRDVPVSWRIRAPDGSVEGTLSARTTSVEAGTGSGAILPVWALFEVEGRVQIEGRSYPVQGLVRHLQN